MRPISAALVTVTALVVSLEAPALHGQPSRPATPAAPRTGAASGANGARVAPPKAGEGITGSYVGTATVQLGDSTIVVPVSYAFTGTAPAISGTAMVPGQGTGTISNVLRDGKRLRFRVTAGEGKLLEHDGSIAANGSIEGFVNLDGLPVAKFRIAPGTLPARPAAPAAPPKARGRSGA